MRLQRDFLISHLHRGLHRGQRSMTAQTGRTYDRTAPSGETSEKALASGAVPHMTLRFPDRADGRLSTAFGSGRPQARTTAADITVGDGPSDGRVDRSSDHRCLPLGLSTRLHDPRP